MHKKISVSLFMFIILACSSMQLKAQEAMIGEIKLVAFNFTPVGWADCDGSLLPIATNTALFSLVGTIYGGDGRSTFALPDLRGRVAVGSGQAPGMPALREGSASGPEKSETAKPGSSEITRSTPTLGLRYIICIKGKYPSRK